MSLWLTSANPVALRHIRSDSLERTLISTFSIQNYFTTCNDEEERTKDNSIQNEVRRLDFNILQHTTRTKGWKTRYQGKARKANIIR